MARFLHRLLSSARRKSGRLLLASSWALGLGIGVLLFRYSHSDILSMMRTALADRVSIVSILCSLFLPFLFSVFAVYISRPDLLYLVCLCKGISFGYILLAVFRLFPGAGWLVRLLFLFSDQMGILLLMIYWYRHISGFRRFSPVGCGVYAALLWGIAMVDCSFVAPLLNRSLIF